MWIVARIDVCRRRARSRAGEVRAAWDMVWGRGLSCKNLNPCGPARVRQAERAQVGEAAAFELPAATTLYSMVYHVLSLRNAISIFQKDKGRNFPKAKRSVVCASPTPQQPLVHLP